MEHLLAFMYRGETTVPTQDLLPLIESAKMLGIQGLMDPGNIKQLLEQRVRLSATGQEDFKVADFIKLMFFKGIGIENINFILKRKANI